MDFLILIIIGVAVLNLVKAKNKSARKPAVSGRAAAGAEAVRETFRQIRTEIASDGRTQMQHIFGEELEELFGKKSDSPAQKAGSVAQPQVAVSMDSRLPDPIAPRVGDHSHPAASGAVRMEYVPASGSLHEEAAAAGEVEGCEEMQNVRYIRVEHPTSVEQARIDPRNVVQGIVWSQVLGKRGGRRSL